MRQSAIVRRLASRRDVVRWLGLAFVVGAALALIGPFGSYINGDLLVRAIYWIPAMLVGLLIFGVAFRVAMRIPVSLRWKWPMLIGVTLIASGPQAVLTRHAAFLLWPELAQFGPTWWGWYGQTFAIGLACVIAMALMTKRRSSTVATPPAEPAAPRIVPFGPDVIALQMEDHYVRVHRSDSSELVLMPLSDAIRQLSGEGLRTHRSWWVARCAVARIDGTARSMRITLSNGVVAPVSRSAVAHLRMAGWLDAAATAPPPDRSNKTTRP